MIHNDYYRCCFNGDSSQLFRQSPFDKYSIAFSTESKSKKVRSFKDEVLINCEMIYDSFRKYTPKLNLFFSGGTDSECFLRCLHELKIPVKPIIIKHKHTPNTEETINAQAVCEELSITPIVLTLDLFELYDSGILHDLGLKYQTSRMGQLELIHCLERINEPCITVDDIQMTYQASPKNLLRTHDTTLMQWFYNIREDEDGLYDRYTALTGIPVITDPFKFTPTSWAALILTKDIRDIVLNYRFKSTAYSTKNKMMSREFGVRERVKTSVFVSGVYKTVTNKLYRDLTARLYTPQVIKLEYYALLNLLQVEYAM